MNTLIGVIASVLILFQNVYLFGGSTKEGVGAYSLLFFLPALIALALLWSGRAFLIFKNYKHRTILFSIFATLIIIISEFILPVSPIKTTYLSRMQQRALNNANVRNVRDEALLSEKGNPIGVRTTFDIEFPRSGAYFVSTSLFPVGSSREESSYFLRIDSPKNDTIEPQPSGTAPDYFFEKGTVYHVTNDITPTFLAYGYHKPRKDFCISLPYAGYPEEELNAALANSVQTKYQVAVEVSTDSYFTHRVAQTFVTQHEYDVKTFYDSVIKEGGKQCRF